MAQGCAAWLAGLQQVPLPGAKWCTGVMEQANFP